MIAWVCTILGIDLGLYQPLWLMLLPVALLPGIGARRNRRDKRGSWARVIPQTLAIALIVLGLAEPFLSSGHARKPWLIFRDVSGSVRSPSPATLPLPEKPAGETFFFAETISQSPQVPSDNATRIVPLLQYLRWRSDEISGAILETDGQFTDTDWPAAAEHFPQSCPLWVVPLETGLPDTKISALEARRVNEQIRLQATLATSHSHAHRLIVRRTAPEPAVLLERALNLEPNEPTTVHLTDRPPSDNALCYEARLEEADSFPLNDARQLCLPPAQRKIAWVGESAPPLQERLSRLLKIPLEIADPQATNWPDYAAIVLADSDGQTLGPIQREGLARYVRQGGGLVLLGSGPFGTPMDRRDPLNQVAALVVNSDQRNPLDLLLVLDASGSMAIRENNQSRFRLAASAVIALARHLNEEDGFTVIAFSDEPKLVYSREQATDAGTLSDALNQVQPAGPTRVAGALQRALRQPNAKARDRLIVVISDLNTEDFEVESLLRQFQPRDHFALVATSLPQEEKAYPLRQLATELDAPQTQADHLSELADLLEGLLRQTRRGALAKGRFRLTGDAPPLGIPDYPQEAQAYFLSAAQPDSDVLLQAGSDPVLARRKVGLGRSVSLALPLEANASFYRQSAALLAGLTEWVISEAFVGEAALTLEEHDPASTLTVSVSRQGRPENQLDLLARVYTPARSDLSVFPLRQTAPGKYEAEISTPRPYFLRVETADGQFCGQAQSSTTGPREYEQLGVNLENLRRLATLTGGKVISREQLPLLLQEKRQAGYRPLKGVLLTMALLAMLADWVWAYRKRKLT